ncbi:unnamed protein product [Amoebophrya sp. A120]|nr:unnamed protein product [Amoebophrya sp. A120]|eukprot:GSA120T00020468001.1
MTTSVPSTATSQVVPDGTTTAAEHQPEQDTTTSKTTTNTTEILEKLRNFKIKQKLGSKTLLLEKDNVEALLTFETAFSEEVASLFAKAEISSAGSMVDENGAKTNEKQVDQDQTTTTGCILEKTLAALLTGNKKESNDIACFHKDFENIAVNDRYVSGLRLLNAADLKLSLVLPADRRDVYKATPELLFRVLETEDLYNSVTKKKFVNNPKTAARDQWVRNIIEGKAEQDRLLVDEEEFLVVRDSKWVESDSVSTGEMLNSTATASSATATTSASTTPTTVAEQLHCLFLLKDPAIRSLRDLQSGKHLALLKQIESKIIPEQLARTYNIPKDDFVAYIHYHPTFWYFHVHIMTVKNPQFTNASEHVNLALSMFDRFHPLSTVIALLEMEKGRQEGDADSTAVPFFAKCPLPLVLKKEVAAWYGVKVPVDEGRGEHVEDGAAGGSSREDRKRRRKERGRNREEKRGEEVVGETKEG